MPWHRHHVLRKTELSMSELPPKPANTVFGIEIDGERKSIGFNSIVEAEQAGGGLLAQGRKVAIFDKVTGKVVKTLS
jgi:hypothetical protein